MTGQFWPTHWSIHSLLFCFKSFQTKKIMKIVHFQQCRRLLWPILLLVHVLATKQVISGNDGDAIRPMEVLFFVYKMFIFKMFIF
jgi:hypothetical protein